MLTALKRWLTPESPTPVRLLALEREAQDLRLQLQECQARCTALEQNRQRERADGAGQIALRVGQLLERAAPAVSQLWTQAHLLEGRGKPVQARDVLAVARRIVRVLEDEGLTVDGAVGAETAFDPDRHAPLGGEITRGEKVVVRFPAVCREGRVLHKAGVEKGQG